jgi:23S rRNA (adenine2503-C2)-methyltransferase
MGTGEPLNNYGPVKTFVEIATDRNGMEFSPRKVTLSTCGLAPAIERLADDGVDVSLAVSLNAATDEVRDRIMPVNRAYPIPRLMEALRYYCDKTGRTVTIEYVLFKDVNDSHDDAKRLMELLRDLPCMINILLFNPFPGCSFERPEEQRAFVMRDMLVLNSYVTVVRNSRGRDINAACGQLRSAAKTSHDHARCQLPKR